MHDLSYAEIFSETVHEILVFSFNFLLSNMKTVSNNSQIAVWLWVARRVSWLTTYFCCTG